MARPVFKIDNQTAKRFLLNYATFYELPRWANDIIRGAKGQIKTGTNQVSSSAVFRLVQSLEVISTQTVAATLNRKRLAVDGEVYCQRMIEYYTSAARCASQGITHQLQKHSQQNENHQFTIPVYNLTNTDREYARRLAIAGSTDELQRFLNGSTSKATA